MSAPRLDLAAIRRDIEADCHSFGESSTVILSTAEAEALLSIAEAAEAYLPETDHHPRCPKWMDDDNPCHCGHGRLAAALAAVRKEETE